MPTLTLNPNDALIIGIDCSGSMNTRDAPNGLTRIEYARERALALIALAELNEALCDVVGFGTTLRQIRRIDTAEAERRLPEVCVANEGGTCLGELVNHAIDRLDDLEHYEKLTLVVFIDGPATDPEAMLAALTENERRGIDVRICGFSLAKFDDCPPMLADWTISFDVNAKPNDEPVTQTEPPAAERTFESIEIKPSDVGRIEDFTAMELPPVVHASEETLDRVHVEPEPVAEAREALEAAPSKKTKKR